MHATRLRIALIAIVIGVLFLAGFRLSRVSVVRILPPVAIGQTVYLSDLPWALATTGWLAIANDGLPAKDTSFSGKPISLRGTTYDKGIGTYPVSEIVYSLDGEYLTFESDVGLDDEVPAGLGGVEFLVFADEVLVYRSGEVRGEDPVRRVELRVEGVQELRLAVVDITEGATVNYADWADARVVRPLIGGGSDSAAVAVPDTTVRARVRQEARAQDAILAQALAKNEMRFLETASRKTSFPAATSSPEQTTRAFDEGNGRLWLKNNYLAISLGYGGDHNGELSVLYLPTQSLIVYRATSEVKLASGKAFRLAGNTRPGGFQFASESQTGLGVGQSVRAKYLASGSEEQLTANLTLFDNSPYFIFEISVERFSGYAEPVEFDLFSFNGDTFNLGESVEYVTDHSRLRKGIVRDDGVVRKDVSGFGKPLLIWGKSRPQAFLLAAIDESEGPTYFRTVIDPGRVMGKVGLTASNAKYGEAAGIISSPRLYFEVTDTSDARRAFDNYKRIMGTLYPPLPMPSWVKYQWLSWYVYHMAINEDEIKRQINYIAANLSDLGSWSVLVDAGWYVSEGREGSDWRNVDAAKFPSGLRALVDYAHAKGVKIVLYFSAPYLDSRKREGDWLGLGSIIAKHPDWLILLGEDESRQSFVYDFSNPELRQYMLDVLKDYFVKYDVDGIKVDGLGNAEGATLSKEKLDTFGLVNSLAGQTMDIYRFIYENGSQLKQDIYVESGWQNPIFASSYAHTFRYGDETNAFSNPYPQPGLLEHIDYAALQKMALGQRPNMGAVNGDPNLSIVNQWWLEAGLALGTQVVLSFDLPSMSNEFLSDYRSLLMHYDAFADETRFGGSLFPDSFATAVGDITYLGVLNRGPDEKRVQLRLSDYGLDGDGPYSVYDVGLRRFTRSSGRIRAQMHGESFRLFVIRKSPGVMWTNSSVHDLKQTASSLELTVKGPRSIQGFINLYAPEPKAVFMDGRQLTLSEVHHAGRNTYWYDAQTSILTLRYNHERAHQIKVEY